VKFNPAHILSVIDLTSLNETDTAETIATLCQKAVTPLGHVAAVCVYPRFVAQVKEHLATQPVRIATVVNFPTGMELLEDVIRMTHQAIHAGAEEIDLVFPYQDYLRGEAEKAYDFVRAVKAACGETILLKVILETGALQDPAKIAEVSYHLCHAGADFLKTSTGKIAIGATLEAAKVMLNVINKIPRPIGFKASGGVRTLEQAEQYMQLAEEIMGKDWVTPDHFRIGASQLIDSPFLQHG